MKEGFCLLLFAACVVGGCARGEVRPQGADLQALQLEKMDVRVPEPPARRAPAVRDTPAPGARAPRIHLVREKDTLWNIARTYYGDGAKYVLIMRANNIAEPKALKVGQKLIIP
jgi:nucleoid-associated protein YgaU